MGETGKPMRQRRVAITRIFLADYKTGAHGSRCQAHHTALIFRLAKSITRQLSPRHTASSAGRAGGLYTRVRLMLRCGGAGELQAGELLGLLDLRFARRDAEDQAHSRQEQQAT